MKEEEKEAIEKLRTEIDNIKISILGFERDVDDKDWLKKITRELKNDILTRETVLNLIETQKAKIKKRDNAVKNIIHRLENDIRNIAKTKSDGYTDDYRRCRLQAYKTKTKEIKEYIEKEYFTKLAEGEKKDENI